jgi:hypothetical protein
MSLTTTQLSTKNLCCCSHRPLHLSAAHCTLPNPSAGTSTSCCSITPLLFGWLLCCPVASLCLSAGNSTSCSTLRLLVIAWHHVVMPVPLVVPPTIFNALVVSPMIRAAAAACIVVVIAIQVVTIAPLASGMGGDDNGGLAIA